MSANGRQVGGEHYRKKKYQHWDWVCDVRLHYLLGCATKYVARWRDKGGVEDLKKAIHYLDKAEEVDLFAKPGWSGVATADFTRQLPADEALIIRKATQGDYVVARQLIADLIEATLAGTK